MVSRKRHLEGDASDPLVLSNFLCFAFYSASLEMTKLYHVLLKNLGLTYPQYLAMVVLWKQNGLSVKDLGELLHLDSGTLTPLLKRLEKMGLIKRKRNPKDERQVLLSLAPAGEQLRKKAAGIQAAVSLALGISAKDARALQQAVSDVQHHIRDYRRTLDVEGDLTDES